MAALIGLPRSSAPARYQNYDDVPGATLTAGTGIDITGSTISTDLTAGTGIDITGNTISTDLTAGQGINISGAQINAQLPYFRASLPVQTWTSGTRVVWTIASEIYGNGAGLYMATGGSNDTITLAPGIYVVTVSIISPNTGGANFRLDGTRVAFSGSLASWTATAVLNVTSSAVFDMVSGSTLNLIEVNSISIIKVS